MDLFPAFLLGCSRATKKSASPYNLTSDTITGPLLGTYYSSPFSLTTQPSLLPYTLSVLLVPERHLLLSSSFSLLLFTLLLLSYLTHYSDQIVMMVA